MPKVDLVLPQNRTVTAGEDVKLICHVQFPYSYDINWESENPNCVNKVSFSAFQPRVAS